MLILHKQKILTNNFSSY